MRDRSGRGAGFPRHLLHAALELARHRRRERDPRVQREGVVAAAGAIAEGRLDPGPLFTTYPLERLGAAFQAMEERPDGFVKALVAT